MLESILRLMGGPLCDLDDGAMCGRSVWWLHICPGCCLRWASLRSMFSGCEACKSVLEHMTGLRCASRVAGGLMRAG